MRTEAVLVSAVGSTNGINVVKALRSQSEYPLEIVGIDSDEYAAGLHIVDEGEVVPRVSEADFKETVLLVCKKYNVKMLIPTHSVELRFYSSNRKAFEEIGVRLMVSPLDVIETCDDKVRLAKFLRDLGVKCPKHYLLTNESTISEDRLPLFIKSRFGSGSTYARKIDTLDELRFFSQRTPDPLIQEYISGDEYTINVISDYEGRVIAALPIKRLKVRGGLSVLGETTLDSGLMEEAKRVTEALHLIGPSNVQIIIRNGECFLIEVNPRFASGTLPLAVAAGLNIPLIMVKLMGGKQVAKPQLRSGVRMARYWDFMIVD